MGWIGRPHKGRGTSEVIGSHATYKHKCNLVYTSIMFTCVMKPFERHLIKDKCVAEKMNRGMLGNTYERVDDIVYKNNKIVII